MSDFKPLEQIADDAAISEGDVVLVKKQGLYSEGRFERTQLFFFRRYGEVRFEKEYFGVPAGEPVKGGRFYDFLDGSSKQGGMFGSGNDYVGSNNEGHFIPFNENPAKEWGTDVPWWKLESHSYFVVSKAKDLPKTT
tara:strand:- start:178 stop:588 length:411 start_codon:yes stop_codon:yes gene_type:complete